MIGLQTGGSVAVGINQLNTPLKDSAGFGAMLSFDRGTGRKLDVLVFGQNTRAERHDPFEQPIGADISVVYAQIGGRYVFHPAAHWRPYVAATIGGTRISAGSGGWVIDPSGGIGGGGDLDIARNVALRFDGRYLVTLVSASTDIGCNNNIGGNCATTTNGSQFAQFIASAGVVLRF